MRLRATRLSATGGNRRLPPFPKFMQSLLAKPGRVAAYYGESWDEILAYNAKQVAAGTPSNCVAFEDSAGTIPLVAPLGSGKGCGLLKDRSGGNHHRIQTSATARGEMSRRVNLLNATDNLADSAWINNGSVSTISGVNAKGNTVWLVAKLDAINSRSITQTPIESSAAGATYRFLLELYAGTSGTVTLGLGAVADSGSSIWGGANTTGALISGPGTLIVSPVGLATVNNLHATIPTLVELRRKYLTGGLKTGPYIYPGGSGAAPAGYSIKFAEIDLRLASDSALPYQRVTSASDYDEEGFPARLKLKTDDWAKSSINPAGANRAFVLTALRVNSSASLGVLAEYGPTAASTDGTFSLESLSSQITLRVRGASAGTTVSASVADSSYVVIGALIDLASPRQELFINGVSAGVSTAAIGSTTFVARDLFVGARNGTSSFANADSTAPLMAVFMQPGDPGLTSAEISRLTAQFKKSIAGY